MAQAPASKLGQDIALTYGAAVKKIFIVLQVQGILILLLTYALYYVIDNVKPQDRFFAETAEGARMQLVDIGTPNIGNESLLAWAEQASMDVLTFGFNDFEKRLALAKPYFSPDGWVSFERAMNNSGLVRDAVRLQQIITTVVRGTPTLLSYGWKQGKYIWIVDVPVIMTIRAGSQQMRKLSNVRMSIIRMPTEDNPRGMGINTWFSM